MFTERLSPAHKLGEMPQRIAVVRALKGLGDLLCAVPAWRALRKALPEAHIVLVGLPSAKSFVERYKFYLDDLLEFPGYPGLPEQVFEPQKYPAFLTSLYEQPFDLAIQMHGSGLVTNPFTMMLGARYNAGFYLPGQYCPDVGRFLPLPAHEPEVCRHLRLMEFLGLPLQGDELEFPMRPADKWELQNLPEAQNLQAGQYVCIHPGASIEGKCWPAERFAEIGDALAAQGLQVVLTGNQAELALTQRVAMAMRAPQLNLAGKTGLGALAALLSEARLLVCNDTGVSHLASALAVPSVVIFVASDPVRWRPLNQQRHRIVVAPSAEVNPCKHAAEENCGRCLRDGCISKSKRTLNEQTELTTHEVWLEVLKLLSEESIYAA